MRPYQPRQIVCEVCGRSCNAAQKGRDICLPCLRKEPSVPCTRCSLTTHHPDPQTGQCPRCVRVTSRLEGVCAHCSRTKVIFNQVAQLCKQCHDHSLVPGQLRKYIANFATPYPYNNVLFDILAAAIDWASVHKQTKRKFHSFGRFLQTQPLNEPLTWEAIEALLPPLGPTHRNDPKLIRACLLELGHPPSGQRGTGNQGNLYRQALRTRSHRTSTDACTSTHAPLRNLAPGAANEADKRARPHGGTRVLLVLERAAQRSPARGSAGIVRQRLFAAPVLEVAVLNLPELDGVRST